MARAKDNLKIEVEQSTTDEVRTVMVTITGKAADFLLPDLLSQRGAIEPYEGALKRAVKEATEGYLGGAEDLIAGITEQKQGRKPEVQTPTPGPDVAGKVSRSRREKPSEEPAMSSVSAVTTTSNGSSAHQ